MRCSVEECKKDISEKKLCKAHYLRFWKYGDPNILKRKRGSAIERFNFMIKKAESGCWEWTGSLSKGYARIKNEYGKMEYIHRWSYKFFIGEIPKDKVIHHECFNPKCANPKHLKAITNRENILDFGRTGFSAVNIKKTHCPKGHAYISNNIYKRPNNNSRYCRKCAKLNSTEQSRKARMKRKMSREILERIFE